MMNFDDIIENMSQKDLDTLYGLLTQLMREPCTDIQKIAALNLYASAFDYGKN